MPWPVDPGSPEGVTFRVWAEEVASISGVPAGIVMLGDASKSKVGVSKGTAPGTVGATKDTITNSIKANVRTKTMILAA